MTRKNYFELLKNFNINPHNEYKKLIQLLENEFELYFPKKELSTDGTPVVAGFVDIDGSTNFDLIRDEWALINMIERDFLAYEKRGTTTSFAQLLEELDINHCNDFETLYTFIECLLDVFKGLNLDIRIQNNGDNRFVAIMGEIRRNIDIILDKTNHELITLENGDKIIIEKNVYASEVSQIVSETSIEDAIKVLEYNHFSNKGNIQRKREILISLAAYLEPLRDKLNASKELKEVMKVNKSAKIVAVEQLFGMYNNLRLRHNNSKQYHQNMPDEELEQWYDDVYTSTLFAILSLDEARILSKVKLLDDKPDDKSEENVHTPEVYQTLSETRFQNVIKFLEYNHFSNKGNLQRKKEMLVYLYKKMELLRNELNTAEELKKVLKFNNTKNIAVERLFEMYHDLFGPQLNHENQINHNSSDSEIEQQYDDIYTSTLFVSLSLDEARILSKLKTLREG